MEELRSTEVLDKEIRSDSVKKAERILVKADESARQLIDGIQERIEKARLDAEKISAERIAVYEKNINASLPLEKQRYLVSYIYNSVLEALNKYLEAAGEKKRLLVLQSLCERAKKSVHGQQVSASVVGFSVSEAEAMLKNIFHENLSSCEAGEVQLLAQEALDGFNIKEGIILKTQDGSVVCRLTLAEKVREILDEKRCVLAETLFGGRLPE
ncbi:hypothetical protein [Treponema sp.]|uniref:hypothetical protein n=1 Tax=Treponema sp. TaxID=166 RepID=UPI003EFCD595